MNIADILSNKGHVVKTVRRNDTIQHLSQTLKNEKMGAMVVSDDGISLDGIISERDIAYGLSSRKGDFKMVRVSTLMATDVITCSSATTVQEAALLMVKNHVRHLPVIDDGKISGVISMRDVIGHQFFDLERRAKNLQKLMAVQ